MCAPPLLCKGLCYLSEKEPSRRSGTVGLGMQSDLLRLPRRWKFLTNPFQPSGCNGSVCKDSGIHECLSRKASLSKSPTKRAMMALLVRLRNSQPNGPKRHCWSEGGSVNILTRFFPKLFALFVSWQCPNQSGPSGSVGQDSDMLADPSPETLISQPSGPQWHCWSGLQQKCQERLPPLSDLAMSQPSGPRWHCWSGLPHAEALDL